MCSIEESVNKQKLNARKNDKKAFREHVNVD